MVSCIRRVHFLSVPWVIDGCLENVRAVKRRRTYSDKNLPPQLRTALHSWNAGGRTCNMTCPVWIKWTALKFNTRIEIVAKALFPTRIYKLLQRISRCKCRLLNYVYHCYNSAYCRCSRQRTGPCQVGCGVRRISYVHVLIVPCFGEEFIYLLLLRLKLQPWVWSAAKSDSTIKRALGRLRGLIGLQISNSSPGARTASVGTCSFSITILLSCIRTQQF